MTTGKAALQGFPPQIRVGPGNPEAEKYGRLWERPEYRAVAPGEALASLFLSAARPRRGSELIDFGCGTGRGGLLLALLGGLRVTLVDFVRNCLDPEIRQACETQPDALRFLKHDLEHPLPVTAQYGFCTDLMEHIPTARVDRVLEHILGAAQHVFFSIATAEDVCGQLIGEPLHLTVQPYGWWLWKLSLHGAVVHWSREDEGRCHFYVSAWRPGRDVVKTGRLNTEEEQIRANVRYNISQGWEQLRPHGLNELEVMILGGGPSLAAFEGEIRAQRARGVKLITLNGTYGWCLDRGLLPSAQLVVDARAFNARFTRPVVGGCKYLLASQCDPAVFDGLPPDRTYLWHTNPALIGDLLRAQYDASICVPGGSTVLLRAIPLLRMLGYRKFHLYGCDSCLAEGAHHAYAQPENDGNLVLPVTTNPGGRIFRCFPWMVSQAQEFIELIRTMGDEVELALYGDGLLRYILEQGAEIAVQEEGR